MSNYPNSLDDPSTLYSPVDAFSNRPLETTTTAQVLPGDTTISVASTEGFAASYGILSIDDELIVYAGKNATQFVGCQRGAFGTQAAQHAQGAAVRANMVAAFITALQQAVLAIENALGTATAWNFVRAIGEQLVSGLKTFQDGAAFGAGAKAGTGLIRLPNAGAIRWRKADGSGDLGLALGPNDHLVADAIIDFAPGQTFGSLTYSDASYTSKGIVQVDAAGGIAVDQGVIALKDTGVTPGTYPKVTVDAKGRVTGGGALSGSDLPTHQHVAGDITSGVMALARGGTGANLSATGPGFLRQTGEGAAVSVGQIELEDLPAEVGQRGGPFQTVGGVFENMAKFSEDFSSSAWLKENCSVSANDAAAPDGNQTADTLTATSDSPLVHQQVGGLQDGGTYTFYIWGRVAGGTRKVSLALVNSAYTQYLAGPTQVTLTGSWQRFRITGTLASGQTGLWIVVRQYAANGDDWTSGTSIQLWGACLQQGDDPRKAYVRTWASQATEVRAGLAAGRTVLAASDSGGSPLKIYGPGSNLADSTLLELTAGGELILAGGSGNGYRFAELGAASNPSGWAGVIRVKTPAGATIGYILLYSNP